jgi:hypothetical protein
MLLLRILCPIKDSTSSIRFDSCHDKITPKITPIKLPINPEMTPYQIKICLIKRLVAPSVFKMAMSRCLSLTAITNVETMLKQATPITTIIAKYIICLII